MLNALHDVLIIGAGVIGCAAARVLSRYDLDIVLVDGACDVAMGASRANSAIVHAGYDAEPGTLMAGMNVKGNALYDAWCADLDVPLGRCGSLVLAFSSEDEKHIQKLYQMGVDNGVPGLRVIAGNEARTLEPAVSEEVTAALYAPTGGITCPYELTLACAQNAVANGVSVKLNWPVTALNPIEGGIRAVAASGETVDARLVMNAAGVHADDIARMLDDHSFSIKARRGEYLLMDREAGESVYTVLFQTPGPMGKGVLVAPTVDGNVFAGPTAMDIEDKTDTAVEQESIRILRSLALRSAPKLPLNKVITQFAGLRAVADTGDFVIRPSEVNPRLIHAAGICSPGLSSAPAIAEALAGLVLEARKSEGFETSARADWNPKRKGIAHFRTMTPEQRDRAIADHPLYARVVCRCEMVTEAEIVEAIRRAPGATTLDGVKRRTRAGMGRCQGGFCAPKVMELLAREMGIPMEDITKNGGASRIVAGKLREDRE